MEKVNEIAEIPAGSRGGKLKAAPIMVYPPSGDQREECQAAADLTGRKLSNFMIHAADKYIELNIDPEDLKRKILSNREEEARKASLKTQKTA